MQSATSIVQALGGIARRDQILAAGCSGTDITASVRLGVLRRIRRAHYGLPDVDSDAVAATRVGGRLGGPSALRTYGVWGGFEDRLHVIVPPNASRLRVVRTGITSTPDISDRVIVLHWESASLGRECWRVPLRDGLRQTVSWCDEETGAAALDTALDLRLISRPQLLDGFRCEPQASRRLAATARAGSGSGYESIVARRFKRLSLRVRQQVALPGVGRIDGCLEGALYYEVDGDAFHRSAAEREVDRRRDSRIVARGEAIIRFGTSRIREDWEGCLQDTLDALRHRIPRRRFQEILRQMANIDAGEAGMRRIS